MTKEQFDERLKALAALVGDYNTMDAFTAGYESLLADVTVLPTGRFAFAERLRRLGDHQFMFLSNAWLKEDREEWAPKWVNG